MLYSRDVRVAAMFFRALSLERGGRERREREEGERQRKGVRKEGKDEREREGGRDREGLIYIMNLNDL